MYNFVRIILIWLFCLLSVLQATHWDTGFPEEKQDGRSLWDPDLG